MISVATSTTGRAQAIFDALRLLKIIRSQLMGIIEIIMGDLGSGVGSMVSSMKLVNIHGVAA